MPDTHSAAGTADMHAADGILGADTAEEPAAGTAEATAEPLVVEDIVQEIEHTAVKPAELGTVVVLVAAVAVVDTRVADMREAGLVADTAALVAEAGLDTDFAGLVQELEGIHKSAVVGIGPAYSPPFVDLDSTAVDTADIAVLEGPSADVRFSAGTLDSPHGAGYTAMGLAEESCFPGDTEPAEYWPGILVPAECMDFVGIASRTQLSPLGFFCELFERLFFLKRPILCTGNVVMDHVILALCIISMINIESKMKFNNVRFQNLILIGTSKLYIHSSFMISSIHFSFALFSCLRLLSALEHTVSISRTWRKYCIPFV